MLWIATANNIGEFGKKDPYISWPFIKPCVQKKYICIWTEWTLFIAFNYLQQCLQVRHTLPDISYTREVLTFSDGGQVSSWIKYFTRRLQSLIFNINISHKNMFSFVLPCLLDWMKTKTKRWLSDSLWHRSDVKSSCQCEMWMMVKNWERFFRSSILLHLNVSRSIEL